MSRDPDRCKGSRAAEKIRSWLRERDPKYEFALIGRERSGRLSVPYFGEVWYLMLSGTLNYMERVN